MQPRPQEIVLDVFRQWLDRRLITGRLSSGLKLILRRRRMRIDIFRRPEDRVSIRTTLKNSAIQSG